MSNKDTSVINLYKKHISIIMVLISTVIISIFVLLFINLHSNSENSNLVNVLGRQRMLTQMITKDVNRIYELYSAYEKYNYIDKEKADLEKKLSETLKSLEKSRNEYESQYSTITNGYIMIKDKKLNFSGILNELDPILQKQVKIWPQFNRSIDIVLNEKSNTVKLYDSVKYINENNEYLLEYSNDITNIVSNYNSGRSLMLFYAIMFLSIIMLISLIIFFVSAYKSLFLPLAQLYKGFEEVGITDIGTMTPITENSDIIPVFSEVKIIFNKLNKLILLIENLSKNVPFKNILDYIFDSFIEFIPYTYIGIALINDERNTIRASYGATGEYHTNLPKRLLGFETSYKETSLDKIIKTGEERIINDLEEYIKKKPLKEYNRILLEEGIRSSITFPLKDDKGVVGIIFFSSNTKNVYRKEHIKFLRTLANSIMLSLEEDILIDDMIISSTLALATLTEERDSETGDHLNRMKTYSRIIAELLSREIKYKSIIDIDFINNIERFSPLHDIGKVAIRDEILLKPGKLSDSEFEIMKTHAVYGAEVLKNADENLKKRGRSIFKMAIEIAEGHHEKWDGSGYPYSKVGEEIPLSARIVAIADVFDALSSKRPYKRAFSFEESIQIIEDGSGKHFDPHIVNIFLQNVIVIKGVYNKFNFDKV